jgi:hypothetical protein
MTVRSGQKCAALSRKPGPVGSWLRTCLASGAFSSTAVFLRWKAESILHKRRQRLILKECLSEKGQPRFGWFWTTLKNSDTKSSHLLFRLAPSTHRIEETGCGLLPTISGQEPGWRHIEVVDRDGNPPEHWNQRFYDKQTGRVVQKGLTQIVRMWPTPTANRWDGLQSHGINVVEGSLNPAWVEWLMGYPPGWTDISTPNPPSPASPPASPTEPPA